MLSPIFFSAYCDKAVTGFFARYQGAILKLKKVMADAWTAPDT